jgi:CO dehydrogenase/acetyl-CoA synthase epsilon subunit
MRAQVKSMSRWKRATRMASRAKNPLFAEGKNAGDRRVKICVRKLTANSGVCAIPKLLVFSIVTCDEGVKIVSKENIFL